MFCRGPRSADIPNSSMAYPELRCPIALCISSDVKGWKLVVVLLYVDSIDSILILLSC
jgi:hypothetical protein